MRETILSKALPKIFHKINLLLRLQNEMIYNSIDSDGTYATSLVSLLAQIQNTGGLTKFASMKVEIQVLIERLFGAILV